MGGIGTHAADGRSPDTEGLGEILPQNFQKEKIDFIGRNPEESNVEDNTAIGGGYTRIKNVENLRERFEQGKEGVSAKEENSATSQLPEDVSAQFVGINPTGFNDRETKEQVNDDTHSSEYWGNILANKSKILA